MPSKAKFSEGEKVLCLYKQLIYEAKILKLQAQGNEQNKYFIHYGGWNWKWDEWVPDDRLLKYNAANVQRQKDLSEQLHATKNRKAVPKPKGAVIDKDRKSGVSKYAKSTSTPLNMNTSLRRKRWARSKKPATVTPRSTGRNTTDRDSSRNVDAEGGQTKTRDRDTTVETAVNRVKIQITLPDELKWWQMDEHDAIKRQHKLLDIPAKKTAKDIIDAYIQWKKSSKSNTPKKEALIADLTGGLIAYFNHELGPNLLYLWERPQYAEILQQYPDTPLVNIYGSFHLLRLFVRLGPVLSFCLGPSDEKGARNLQSHLEDFVKYLDQNRAALFSLEHFADASPEYHRKAQQIEMC